MSKKTKTRTYLDWQGCTAQAGTAYLLGDPEKSYHAKYRVSDSDIFDNQLIFGDNLLALKALEAKITGKVKCVFIDPPVQDGSCNRLIEELEAGLTREIGRGNIFTL